MKLTIGVILFVLYSVNAEMKMCQRQHGGFGEWMRWGPCRSDMQNYDDYECSHRYCDNPVPKYGGYPCMGDKMRKRMRLPVNGGFSDWMKWGPCSKTCGEGGMQTRHRFCDNPLPMYGGKKCAAKESMESRSCPMKMEPCPPEGELGKAIYGPCSKGCGGTRSKTYSCNMPKDYTPGVKCYTGCRDNKLTSVRCRCETEPRFACRTCTRKNERENPSTGNPATDNENVGLACKLDGISAKVCNRLSGGIRDMYPSNDWFFIHCSDDGPWCKPCATRGLVYNPKCGQCETTRNGECTGPQGWQKKEATSNDEVADILNDDDLW